MAQLGYGITHTQLKNLAGDLAVALGKRQDQRNMSNNWVYRFLERWDNRISSVFPQGLESTRAKAATPEVIEKYYSELERIMTKYNLHEQPHKIFNVDETGLKPEHKPSKVLASKSKNVKPNTITSPKGNTTTLYGCVSAVGQVLPPFFIFKGVRANEALLNGALPGTTYTMSASGWSNSETFLKFMDHFIKYTQAGPQATEYTLLLLDGHSSHVTKQVIDKALENKIVIFVLPPHTSHLTQPLDVGCFGPFKRFYYSECDMWLRTHMGQTMTRYEICEVACKAYPKAMTYKNITNSFEKCGIYPLNKKSIPVEKTFPAEAFREEKAVQKVKAIKGGKAEVEQFLLEKVESMQVKRNESVVEEKKDSMKKPAPGGLAITEDEFKDQLELYERQKLESESTSKGKGKGKGKGNGPKGSDKGKGKGKGKGPKGSDKGKRPVSDSPKPSTSGIKSVQIESDGDSDMEIEIQDSEKCCVCGRYEPQALAEAFDLEIVDWAQCSGCGHWVHLKYCTPIRCVRTHAEFFCVHCL